ncbi:pentapeptide repeat-containing protein [Microbacterium sp. STN6]|uniref:pentapeptide repeat-containing protein n=1 Tax=Microbacterium sp. STN6 TaxID=2995588 RepID=UPI002260EABD|nr:pentapeptide repeat-containing protein [Microbacterium sp. STN6]MCX7521406.1 pentapeptide repeat-containing protein [Microbacterium sp. STN6]
MAQRTTTLAPRIDPVRLSGLVDDDGAELGHSAFQEEGKRFSGLDLTGRDLSDATFSECEFIDVSLHQADLQRASVIETTMERVNAPVLSAARSRFRDVVVSGSRIGSGELYDASWQSVRVENCKLGFLNLRGARLLDVLFVDCVIDELDLGGAKAKRVAFAGTSVASLDVTQAELKNVDLRDAQLHAIRGIMPGLRGATMSSVQVAQLADTFAAHLGIVVDE